MSPPIQGRRQPLPTILTVYRPIEEYQESTGSAGGPGPSSSDAFDPLDAYLIHRLLDLVPGDPVLIDEAMVATGGASSLIGLNHPRVRGVWAVVDRGSPGCQEALSALRGHLGRRIHGQAPLEVVTRSELPAVLADRPGAVILTQARSAAAGPLAEEVGRWLDRRHDAVVLVMGLGKVGHCPAMASLMNLCTPPESGMRFELLRELGEVLIASRLGLIARRDDPGIAEVLERLRLSFSGNFRYLDLLRQVNDAAMREARIDADTLRAHPTFGPLSEEIEGLKRRAHEAEQRAAMASMTLREMQERPCTVVSIGESLSLRPGGGARRLAGRIRRKLSPTPVGGAWRLAKRVRRKLAPMPVGGAWRLARRGIGACLGRGG